MKEQDYMNIMGAIRGEYLEEAVSWDGSERRRIRQIRRMTVSFGAVAAALAVVVGMIAYKANKDRIEIANSVPESSIVSTPDESSQVPVIEQETNLFGGHGEVRQIQNTMGSMLYDDEYLYLGMSKVSLLQSGKYIPMDESAYPAGLMTDGRTLFRLHDGKLFETDSYGNETELMNLSDYQLPENSSFFGIKKLSSRMLVLQSSEENPQQTVIDLQGKKALKTDQVRSVMGAAGETGYYAMDDTDGSLYLVTLNNGTLKTENVLGPVYSQNEATCSIDSAKLDGGKLYMIAREITNDEGGYIKWHIVRDLATGKMVKTELPGNQNIYLGSALIRSAIEDGAFTVYRSNLDLSNETRILHLPVSDYIDVQTYGMPDVPLVETVTESPDLVRLVLPVTDSKGSLFRTLHGEESVIIDLRTGKTVFTGPDYNDNAEPDNAVSVTAAEAAGTTAETTVLTTETSAVTTAVTTDSMTEEQRKALAKELIRNYCYSVESLAYGSSDNLDISDMREVAEANAFGGTDQIQYARVKGMHSIAEIRQEMQKHVTGAAYEELISFMEGRAGSCAGKPVYREFDGKLYSNIMGKGAEFMGWLWDTMTVEQITENGFTVTVKEESYGGDIIIHRFECTDLQDGTDHSFRVSRHTEEDTGKTLSGEPVS